MSIQDSRHVLSGPHIRSYNPKTDERALIYIFRETADKALKTEPAWSVASYLWARPYATLTPQTCFVLVNPSGTPVGYCIGTGDTGEFARRWETEFLPGLDQNLLPTPKADAPDPAWANERAAALTKMLYNPRGLLHEDLPGLWERYPGHLHIDILEGYRGAGHGRRLVAALLERLRQGGCKGVHLGMVADNAAAGSFYEKLGFARFQEVLDDGKSGEMGRTSHKHGDTVFYCKEL